MFLCWSWCGGTISVPKCSCSGHDVVVRFQYQNVLVVITMWWYDFSTKIFLWWSRCGGTISVPKCSCGDHYSRIPTGYDLVENINNRRSMIRSSQIFFFVIFLHPKDITAGLSGSVGCAVRLETRRSRVQPLPRSATFFRGDGSWNIFYGHSLPSADSIRAVLSFWRKNVHNTGYPLRGLSLPSKRVVR